jgi:hypothetical protein
MSQVKLYYCPSAPPSQRSTRSGTVTARSRTAAPQLVAGYTVDATDAAAAVEERKKLANNSNWSRTGFTARLRRFEPPHAEYTLCVTSEVAATSAAATVANAAAAATDSAANGSVSGSSSVSSALVVHGVASTASAAAAAADEPVVYTTTVETWLISSVLAPEGTRDLATGDFKPLVSTALLALQLHLATRNTVQAYKCL